MLGINFEGHNALRIAVEKELEYWKEELANCNGQDAANTAQKHIERLSWALYEDR